MADKPPKAPKKPQPKAPQGSAQKASPKRPSPDKLRAVVGSNRPPSTPNR